MMTSSTPPLSALARRISPPAISKLMQAALSDPNLISLAAGFVDQATLPVDLTADAVEELRRDPASFRRALQYGTTAGLLELRERLIERLEREDGAAPGAWREAVGRTIVTNGSQQLLSLISQTLVDPGDIVLVEAPTYFVFMGMLETVGARAIGIATDEGGMRLDSLEDRLQAIERRGELDRVKFIYTVSEHGNPTGLSLAPERRGPLVEIAKRWSAKRTSGRIYILEDAAYRGVGFGDAPEPPSVWSRDEEGETVILARTFSKTFSPGLKTGYGVLPRGLWDVAVGLKGNQDFGSSNWNQWILARVLGDPRFDRHVDCVRQAYQRKCDALTRALAAHLGPIDPEIRWTKPNGGIYVWLSLPTGVDAGGDGEYFQRCREHGVIYVPGHLAYPNEPDDAPRHEIRLCYGVCELDELEEGARRLAVALRETLARTQPRSRPLALAGAGAN